MWKVCRLRAETNQWTGHTVGLFFAIVFILFPVSCSSIMYTLPAAMCRVGHGVSGEEANRHLRFTNVPDVATDVLYRHDCFSGLTEAAEFSCTKQQFLEWANDNGWKPEAFNSSEDVKGHWRSGTSFTSVFSSDEESIQVDRGYYFDYLC